MERVASTTARESFAELLNKVGFGGARIIVHRNGKDVVALIPVEDLQLLEAIEDRLDVKAARKALKEKGSVPWEKVKADLAL